MLGVRRTERVLPVGMALTVVGELSAGMPRSVTGPVNLVLKQPMGGEPFYITTKSLPELLESLSSLSRVCKVPSPPRTPYCTIFCHSRSGRSRDLGGKNHSCED